MNVYSKIIFILPAIVGYFYLLNWRFYAVKRNNFKPYKFKLSGQDHGIPPLSKYNLVVATQVKNQNAYLPEWIEHHRLVGVDRIVMYCDVRKIPNQASKTRAIVEPWIRQGFLEWVEWPLDAFEIDSFPFGPRIWLNDTIGKKEFNFTLFNECLSQEEGLHWHKHSKCQRAAFLDAIARYRFRTKWIGIWDIDEFMFLPWTKDREIKTESEIPSLNDALKEFPGLDQLKIHGRIFGTNGYFENPITNLDSSFPLVTQHYNYRMEFEKSPQSRFIEGYNWAEKSFCQPMHVSRSAIHNCKFENSPRPSSSISTFTKIYMNHYQYRSIQGAYTKALSNTNWNVVYQPPRDIYFNQIPDYEINYISNFVQKSLRSRYENGEWAINTFENSSSILKNQHTYEIKNPSICIALRYSGVNSSIPMLRKTIHTIRYFLSKTDPSITYETAIVISNQTTGPAGENLYDLVKNELKINKIHSVDYNLETKALQFDKLFFDLCSAPYILSLEDFWETRMGDWWAENVLSIGINKDMVFNRVISNSIRILEADKNMLEVWVGDTLNNISEYSNVSEWSNFKNSKTAFWYRKRYGTLISPMGVTRISGSLKHRERLLKIGRIGKIDLMLGYLKNSFSQIEFFYAAKAAMLGFHSGQICLSRIGPTSNDQECALDPELFSDGATTGIAWRQRLVA